MTTITEHELLLLREINEAVSDYLLALEYDEFAAEWGGVEVFLEALRDAQYEWEMEYNTMTDEEIEAELSGVLN